MQGSGFEDIVIEAGICASGSLKKVMSGKHYNHALRVHKLMLEGLEHLLFQVFENQENSMEGLNASARSAIHDLSKAPNAEMFKNMVSLEDLQQLYQRYCSFKESIRNGSFGKTAVFWINYMDIVWLLLTYIRTTKENNYDLHLNTLFELCPLFFAYNHQNLVVYSRYIPAYLITMLNLSETHLGADDLLRNNGFSVSPSSVPSSRNPVDITTEQTINQHAKSHGSIIGFSWNYVAYYCWCTTYNQEQEATLSIADMTSNETSIHKELRQSQIKSSEVNVKKVIEAFLGFTNPFFVASKRAVLLIFWCAS